MQPKIQPLLEGLAEEENESLLKALNDEAGRRFTDTLRGLTAYLTHPYKRTAPDDAPAIWSKDGVRLLDYSARGSWDGKTTVLLVPSLINRAYVFDLKPDASFVTYLARQGIRPLVLDWGTPTPAMNGLDCAGYMTTYLIPAMEWLQKNGRPEVHLAGYCMGGVFALALTQLMPKVVRSLALLATPWDFHVPEFFRVEVDGPFRETIRTLIRQQPLFSSMWLQSLFYMGNPWIFHRKYQKFAGLDPESAEAEEFVALEEWVNDGVDLTAAVAEECLLSWVTDNALARRQWRVAGKTIDPAAVTAPVFAAIPEKDRVVPPSSAAGLLSAIPHAQAHRPVCGHLGIMAGSQAEPLMWQPYTRWLRGL